ncbi:MAG: HAD hydrolase-like protein, partial [Candidatus Thorarchaeota archaeon]|nr:HAD hydrolase-like protein [Candidatus Thorarchaeota archaeon]
VGDRLYTDIAMGVTGITTILVLSGETKEGDIKSAIQQPDYVVKDLSELREIYSAE